MIEVTNKAKSELTKLLEENVGKKLRIVFDGFG